MAGSHKCRQNIWSIFDTFPQYRNGRYKYIHVVKRWFLNRCILIIQIHSVVHFFFNMLHTRFMVNLHSIVAWMSRNPLLETVAISRSLSDCNEIQTHNHLRTQPFSKTGQISELCREYLSIPCVWLYVLVMSYAHSKLIYTL